MPRVAPSGLSSRETSSISGHDETGALPRPGLGLAQGQRTSGLPTDPMRRREREGPNEGEGDEGQDEAPAVRAAGRRSGLDRVGGRRRDTGRARDSFDGTGRLIAAV